MAVVPSHKHLTNIEWKTRPMEMCTAYYSKLQTNGGIVSNGIDPGV